MTRSRHALATACRRLAIKPGTRNQPRHRTTGDLHRHRELLHQAGQPVTLKIRNEAWLIRHDRVVRAPAAGMDFEVNLCGHESGTATVTPARTGNCRMYCVKKPFFGKTREARGMHGRVEVVRQMIPAGGARASRLSVAAALDCRRGQAACPSPP